MLEISRVRWAVLTGERWGGRGPALGFDLDFLDPFLLLSRPNRSRATSWASGKRPKLAWTTAPKSSSPSPPAWRRGARLPACRLPAASTWWSRPSCPRWRRTSRPRWPSRAYELSVRPPCPPVIVPPLDIQRRRLSATWLPTPHNPHSWSPSGCRLPIRILKTRFCRLSTGSLSVLLSSTQIWMFVSDPIGRRVDCLSKWFLRLYDEFFEARRHSPPEFTRYRMRFIATR